MQKEKSLIIKNFADLGDFLQKTTIELSEAITGFLASETNDKKLAAGHIVQSIFKGNLLTQFGRELKNFRDKGLIKEDYFATHKQQATLVEFLKFIDGEETPDEERFKAMKSIFFSSIAKDTTDEDEILAYQLMQTAKQLSSAEIHILFANYAIVKNTGKPLAKGALLDNRRIDYWAQTIAEKIGHNLPDLVLQHETHLIVLNLIMDRHYMRDRNEIPAGFLPSQTSYFRLTSLGFKLCEYITKYE